MPTSQRGPMVPRMPLSSAPRVSIGTALNLSPDTIQQIAAVWKADLEQLRRELRPWYVRLWDWWRDGR